MGLTPRSTFEIQNSQEGISMTRRGEENLPKRKVIKNPRLRAQRDADIRRASEFAKRRDRRNQLQTRDS